MATGGAKARAVKRAIERFGDHVVEYDPKALDDPRCVERIALSLLTVDSAVQRSTPPERVDQLAREWDWRYAEVPTVRKLPNGNYLVDEGQARVLAARKRAPAGHIWCIVVAGTMMITEGDVDIALQISTGRRTHNAFDRWQLRLTRGDEHETAADKVLNELGLRLGKTSSAATISGVAAVTSIVHGRRRNPEAGAELLHNTLHVVVQAWPTHDHESKVSRFDHRLLTAISEIITRNPQIDLARLARTLRSKMASRWINDVTQPAKRTELLASNMIGAYNRGVQARKRISW